MKTLALAALTALTCAIALPAAAQTAPAPIEREALPPELDPGQTPEEMIETRALNAGVVADLDAVDQHNAVAAEINDRNIEARAIEMERLEAVDEANRRAHDADLRAAAAAEQQYQHDMAVWRQRAADCENGVRGACVTPR